MVGLVKHTGRIRIGGHEISPPHGELNSQVRRDIQMIFRDPMRRLIHGFALANLSANPWLFMVLAPHTNKKNGS